MERVSDAETQMAEDMVVNGGDGMVPERSRRIISGEQLDVEAYAALYSGRTKIARLIFIADHCGENQKLQLEALRLAYDEIKKGENTQLYREVVLKINGRLGPQYEMDAGWCEAVDRRADQTKRKLENELNSFKTNMIKGYIRTGFIDLGDFYYAHGVLGDAYKNYVRTRDYCSTSKHIFDMCMRAILVSIEMGQFIHVVSYVGKAEQSTDAIDPVTSAKLTCAIGLVHLESNKYKLAARKFLDVAPELGTNYTEVIAPQDVGTYGGLCALASFDRAELKSKVIDNFNFRYFLELVPEVRELVNDFYSSRYASCLDYLNNLREHLLLDIHLHDHVDTLYDQIRNKALIRYTLPFTSVDLHMMANAFRTSVSALEKELEALITENQIQARIDSLNKILYGSHADQRKATFQRVLQTGNKFDRDVRGMLRRANLLKHEFHAAAKKI